MEFRKHGVPGCDPLNEFIYTLNTKWEKLPELVLYEVYNHAV